MKGITCIPPSVDEAKNIRNTCNLRYVFQAFFHRIYQQVGSNHIQ